MQRRSYLKAIATATAAANVPAFPALADDEEIVDLDAGPYRTNEQVTRDLQQLEQHTDRIQLREIGRSAHLGDPIWEATIGSGNTRIHAHDQIHGDEPAGTEVTLLLLRQLAEGTSPQVEHLLDNLTITFVPRSNPDGAMYREDTTGDGHDQRVTRRQNTQEWNEGDSRYRPYYHVDSPGGYDINRDFNIDPDFHSGKEPADWWRCEFDDGEEGWYIDQPEGEHVLRGSGLLLTPEARALTDSFLDADPEFALSHHHQNLAARTEDEDPDDPEKTLMSLMAVYGTDYEELAPYYDPDAPTSENVNPFIDEETSNRSLRLNRTVAEALSEQRWDVFDTVSRYGYAPLWGDYLDALCPQTDAAGILYEVTGQSDDLGNESFGLYVEATRIAYTATLSAIADDPTLSGVDEMGYFDIPLRGPDLDELGSGRGSMLDRSIAAHPR